jgi:Tol biopolymer transport system component
MLYVRPLSDVDAHPLTLTAGLFNYAFAPDGKRIAVMGQDGKLRIVPLDGGPSVTVAQMERYWSGIGWADNKSIVIGSQPSGEGLWLVNTTGGAPRQVLKAKPTFSHGKPFVAEDGETVAFVDWGPGFTEDDYLAIGSLKTGKFETSKLVAQGIAGIVDGRVLYTTAGGNLMGVRFDRRSHRVSGDPERLIEGLTQTNDLTAVLSVSGTLLYERGQATDRLVLADSTGLHPLSSDERTLTTPGLSAGTVRYSPDGRRIAVNVVEVRSDVTTSNIWTFDVGTRTFSPLTTRGDVVSPEWTPDGRRLVFIRWFERKPGIFWQAADGSDSAQSLVQLPDGQSAYTVSVTQDGRGFVYCAGSIASAAVSAYYLSFSGGVPEKLVETDAGDFSCNARASPDGRWLAYVVGGGSQPQVYVRPFRAAGGRVQVSTDGGTSPVWSGNRLYYRSAAGGSITAATLRSDAASLGVTKRELMPGTRGRTVYDVAPDGKHFVMTESSDAHKRLLVTTNWVSLLRARPR